MFLIISHLGDDTPIAMKHTKNLPDDNLFLDEPGVYHVIYRTSEPVEKIWLLDTWFYFTLTVQQNAR